MTENFSYCTTVSPLHRVGAVPAPLLSGVPKWRGNFPEGSGHPVMGVGSRGAVAPPGFSYMDFSVFFSIVPPGNFFATPLHPVTPNRL